MKKIMTIIFSLFIMFVLVGCSYSELKENEHIYIAPNSVRSLIFNRTEYGYNNSISFYVYTTDENNSYIKQGKIYNDTYTYYKLVENRDCELLNAVNGQLFFSDDNGLQSVINYDNEIIDHAVSYVRNGFGEVIQIIGTHNFVNSITTEENQIKENVDNKDIKYVGKLSEKIEDDNIKMLIKKEIIVSYLDNKLYIDRLSTTKTTHNDGQIQEQNQVIKFHIDGDLSIKKAIIIDYLDVSKTILLLDSSEIIIVDNYDFSVKRHNKHSNVAYFESVNTHFYVIENNTLYVYNALFELVLEQKYEDIIIGSTWLKERSEDYIRIATMSKNEEISLHKILIENDFEVPKFK